METVSAKFLELRYGQCWEDADVLVDALDVDASGTYLSIASAGDNCLALVAAGARRVIAVDVNPAQVACLELRVAGYRHLTHDEFLAFLGHRPCRARQALYRRCRPGLSVAARDYWDGRAANIEQGFATCGKFERYLAAFRRYLLPLIHDRATVERLFTLATENERRRFYEEEWCTRRFDWLCRLFFGRLLLGRLGRDPSFTHYADEPVWQCLSRRLPNALIVQRPADNPYLQWILTGRFRSALPFALRAENFARIRSRLEALEWHVAPIEELLGTLPDQSVYGCNLSNIFEYVSPAAHESLLVELARVGAPGCRFVYWNVVVERECPQSLEGIIRRRQGLAMRLHERDKAFFYRRLIIEEVR